MDGIDPPPFGMELFACLVIFRLATGDCSSPSTTATRFATSISPTSARKTTPAPGLAGLAFTPISPASIEPSCCLDERPGLGDPPALSARHAHHQRRLDHRELQARDVLQRRGRFPSADSRPQDQSQKPRALRPRGEADASPGLQHVRHEDRRHRLLRSGTALDRSLSRQAIHHGDVLLDRASSASTNSPPAPADFTAQKGTWRDAEDGHLQGNPIAQGAVDSTVSLHVHVPPDGEKTVYMVHDRRQEPRGTARTAQVDHEDRRRRA